MSTQAYVSKQILSQLYVFMCYNHPPSQNFNIQLRLYDRLGFKEHGRTILHGHHGEEDVGPDGTTPTEPLETIMICLAIQPDEIYS